jgi:hypothetical protein
MENKELNLCEILKDCPKGTKLYSPIYGFMKFHSVKDESYSYPIFMADADGCLHTFHPDGTMFLNAQAECCLFPSKNNRDWSTFKTKKERFDPNTLKPFDKVLVRDYDASWWVAEVFSHTGMWQQQIPYNSDTAHLVGTNDDAPEYYKWWEE